MGILGDVEDFGGALIDGVTGHSSQPKFAAVPAAGGPPPKPVEPVTAAMPDASGSGGHITVHRDVLRKIASDLHSDVAELDAAVEAVKLAGASLGSTPGFPTGSAFYGNVQNAATGFGHVGAYTSDTQTNAAKTLTDSASSYDEAESQNTQQINSGPNSTLNASASSVSSASGI
jgi:hypothetical protein